MRAAAPSVTSVVVDVSCLSIYALNGQQPLSVRGQLGEAARPNPAQH
jgi:hypothetical protein